MIHGHTESWSSSALCEIAFGAGKSPAVFACGNGLTFAQAAGMPCHRVTLS